MRESKCYLNTMGILCSIGDSKKAVKENLLSLRTNIKMTDQFSLGESLPLGLCHGELPAIPLADKKWQSRNNQFALAVLKQIEGDVLAAIKSYGANRVGVVIGTSTSGIAENERAIKEGVGTGEMSNDYDLQEMGATAQFIGEVLGVGGPVYGVSTACSSGAKALASARRLIRLGVCDAVIAGGVDTLCQLTVEGFSSLQAVSNSRCNPFSEKRTGINIGEGAALFLISSVPLGVELTGVGEGSDAYHISAPDPSGSGAIKCMSDALNDAGIVASEVGYVNLHGTGTQLNDAMESKAMHHVFGESTFCSSTKPFTGHTLGAAGAVEAGICWIMLENNDGEELLPVHIWDGVNDTSLPNINLVMPKSKHNESIRYVLSNSFAFGGNNISLLLGRNG